MQVYLAPYAIENDQRHFLVGKKRTHAKFFLARGHRQGCRRIANGALGGEYQEPKGMANRYHHNDRCFVVYQNPILVTNGGGSRCFIGGRGNGFDGAKREFHEETGADTRDFDFDAQHNNADFSVFFVRCASLAALRALATGINNGLSQQDYQRRIQAGILDDELECVEIKTTAELNNGIFVIGDRATGWFHEALNRVVFR